MSSTLPRSRRRTLPNSEPLRARPQHRLKATARYLYLAVIVIAPWTFGGVYYQTQTYLYAALLVCGLMWLCSLLCESQSTSTRYQFPLLILPIALGVILGTVQLIPLSSADSRHLGPPVSEELQIAPDVAGFERDSISIYPPQTRVTIASLSFALLAFFLATQLFSDQKSQLLLFGAVALTGLALSFFGLAQKLSWNQHLYWEGPRVVDGKPFAAWVNRNNAAGFLNMTFAAALGMLVWASYHKNSKNAFEYDLIDDGWGGGIIERINGYFIRLGRLTGSQLLFGSSIVVIAAGVIGSSSRGGILSLGAGLLAALAWFVAKGRTRMATTIGLLVLVPAIGLLSWLGISSSVSNRFAELNISQFQQTARFQNWRDTLRGLPEIWITGSGLGTYEYFHRPYQQHTSEAVYEHAENQYVEALIEGGAVGLGLLVLAILLGYAAVVRLSTSRMIQQEDGVALVGLVVLTTQFCQAFLDFGLTLPANMLLMAVLMGAVTGRAAHKLAGGRGSWRIAFPRMHSKATPALFAVLLIGNGALGWMEIERAAVAQETLIQVRRTQQTLNTPESAQAEQDRVLSALSYRPDDAELLLTLSETYVRTYELSVQGELESSLPPDILSLYSRVSKLERFGSDHSFRTQPIVLETLIPARNALLAAEASCEWSPQVEYSLALVSVLEEPVEKRIQRLERVLYLAPREPRYHFLVGYLAHASGDDELCLFAWKRAFELSPQLRYPILMQLIRPDEQFASIRDFLPRDPFILRNVIEYPTIQNAYPEIVDEVLGCFDEMQTTKQNAVTADELFLVGFREKWQGQLEAAVAIFEEAIQKDPTDLGLRKLAVEILIELADLEHLERLKRAEFHLAIALTYMNSSSEYDQLSGRLDKRREELEKQQAALDAATREKDGETAEENTEQQRSQD